MTSDSGTPLSRAIEMYSLSSTSIVEARIIRVMYGSTASVSVRTGRTNTSSCARSARSGPAREIGGKTWNTCVEKQQDEGDADDELRQRRERERADRHAVVELGVALQRAVGAEADRERHADQRREQHQDGGVDRRGCPMTWLTGFVHAGEGLPRSPVTKSPSQPVLRR